MINQPYLSADRGDNATGSFQRKETRTHIPHSHSYIFRLLRRIFAPVRRLLPSANLFPLYLPCGVHQIQLNAASSGLQFEPCICTPYRTHPELKASYEGIPHATGTSLSQLLVLSSPPTHKIFLRPSVPARRLGRRENVRQHRT